MYRGGYLGSIQVYTFFLQTVTEKFTSYSLICLGLHCIAVFIAVTLFIFHGYIGDILVELDKLDFPLTCLFVTEFYTTVH